MNHIKSTVKRIALFFIAITFLAQHANAQITNLRFSNEAATYVPISGGTSLVAAGTALGAASAVTNIGFTFKFQGVNYTQFSVNAAGLLKLGSVVVTNESANNPITTTNTPKIYALWDAFYTGNVASGGGVSYVLSGSAPNRVLTVQWKVGFASNAATTTNFQVLLYETSNKIEFLYGSAATLSSASVGLGGIDAANDYLSVWTPNGVVTTNGYFTTNTVIPGTSAGQKYTFTPTTPLTTSPACLTDAPNLWLKADAGVNYTRTLLNVPSANRSSPSVYTQTPAYNPANSVLTGSPGWMPSMADGANSTPAGSTAIGAITLDLGSVRTIDGVATLGSGTAAYYTLDYTVKVSNDNVTYTTLGVFQGNESATELHYADFDASVSCRYVRVIPGAFTTYRAIRLDVYTKTVAPLPANNTKVSVWEDLSGNNWDASLPTTTANQPTFLTNQFNFNPALNFAATTTKLDIPDYDVAMRLVVRATTLGGIPELVVTPYSPVSIHTNITGIQEMAENISYPFAPTATQQNVAKSYLATKYGITKADDYVAADGTTKTFDLTANAGYTNNIFGIGRADCQDLHQRQSKSVNTAGLISIGNNNIIDFTNGNTSAGGNNIATDNSYLLLGDNGGSLDLNTNTLVDSKYFVNRTWKLQETGTIGSVKISVPAFGNTAAASTLPILPAGSIVHLAIDNDGNFTNGGTTYVAMTAVGSGATATYEASTDLTASAPYVRFAVAIPDTDGDTVNNLLDIDDDNDGVVDAVESPACYYINDEMSAFESVSSDLTQYSTYLLANSIDASATSASAFNQIQNWEGKEIFRFTAKAYTTTTGLTLDLVSWALSNGGASTFKLQGSGDGLTWTDLSTAKVSTASTGSFTVNNTLAPNTKFKYFRLLGVSGSCSYGGVQNVTLNISGYNPSAFPKATCAATDTDADGVPNNLDLDSDGDGCPDAFETGVTGTLNTGTVVNLTSGSTTSTPSVANAIVGGPYSANGLATALQTSGNGVYTGLYAYNYALTNKYNLCADFDGDGVKDIDDLDDDNDGILDHIESPSCFVTKDEIVKPISVSSELTQYSTHLIGYSIDNDPVTKSAFITGQDWVGKEIFKLTAATNMLATGVSLDMNSWAFTANGSHTFKLQGSSDNYIWSDLSAPMSSQATTGTVTINNTLLPNVKFKYLRIVGVVGISSYIGVTDIRINIPAGFNSSAHPKEICTTDTDADGKLNHQDLDSDGDGCFDAVEAGVLTSSADGKLPTPWGANGLADAKETVAESGIFNGYYSYDYAINNKYNLCADFDGDGIKDIVDLDDDNDGILDHVESPSCFYTLAEMIKPVSISSELTQYSTYVIGYAIDNDPVTKSAFITGQNWVGQEIFKFTAAGYTLVSGVSMDMNSWSLSTDANSKFKLQGSQDNYNWSDLSAPMASIVSTGTVTVSNTLLTTTKFKYLRIIGVAGTSNYGGVLDLRINMPANFSSSANPKEVCISDKDADGKLNHQDLDADEDGCFDAVEAGVLPRTSSNGIVPGAAFGTNGFADALETVAENGVYKNTYSYDYAINALISNCTDTDGDGVLDLMDIDDDNDGVLDADEAPTCYMNFQEWNTANKAQSVTITSDLNALAPNINFASLTDNATTAAVQFVTATAQDQNQKELFRASFAQPVQLDAIYVKKTTATQIFAATASSLMLQGSNDPNGVWTNLLTAAIASPANATNITVNGSVSLTNSNIFTVSANAGKYKYYRIFGVANATALSGIAAEFYFDVNRTAYIPSAFTKATCTTDTDADNIINTLDLDSDGDGCADAVEGNANRAATSTSTHPTGTDANNNGLLDNYEGTPAGTVSYYPTYNEYAIVASINACLDTDNDTVPDSKDLDDDNDGILDADEQINCAYPQKDLSTLTFNGNANGVFTGSTLTLAGPGSWSSKYSDQKLKLPIHLEFTMPTLTNEGMIGLLPVGAAKTPTNWNDGAYKIYAAGANINGFIPASAGNKINRPYVANELMEMDINAAGVVTVRQNGWVIFSYKGLKKDYNFAFSAKNAKVFENIKLTSYSPLDMVCEDIDSDGDGIVNRLDLDSDNDGCNDAVEAGAANTTVAVPFTGAVGTNGVVDSMEDGADSGDLMYVSTYSSYAKNANFNACADTDGDTVGDLKDIDDDNDGVTDDIEEGCSSPLFVNKTSTSNLTTNGQLTGTILKETGNINYELNMKGPALYYYQPYYEGGNGLHFQVSDYNRMNMDMDFKLTSTSFETSPVAGAPKIKWVDFGPNVPVNLVPNQPINEAQNITLTWPGAYAVVYDPYNQLSSHNTGDIIESGDLIEQNVNISAADIVAKKTWKVRMFMHNPSDVYLINANIYGNAILGQQSYGFNVSACSIFDTDADGKPNTIDSDSDGDGTSDAFEGNATSNPALSVVPGPYGDNGFADGLETSDEVDATVNYTTTYNQATASNSNKAADSDGDGVLNVIDIDDDNDGILDSEETTCGPAYFSIPNLVAGGTGQLQTVTGTFQNGTAFADYEINLVGVSNVFIAGSELFNNSFDNSKGGLHYLILDNDNTYSQTFKLTPTYPTTLSKVKFGVNVPSNAIAPSYQNNAQSIAMTWSPDVPAVIYDPNDQIVEFATGAVVYSGTTITLRSNYTLANSTWRVDFGTEGSSEQFFLQTTHKATNSADVMNYEGFGINADLCFVEDTDGDGTPDYIDNDSDGDGCSDAFEAGAISTPGGPTQKLTGSVGANGLVNTIENNDTETALVTYASTAYMAYSPVSSCADFDGDGVPDRDDIDDDNDGITDYIEYDCGIGKFVKSYIVTSGLGMSIGGTFNNANYKGSGTWTFSNLSALNSVSDATNYANYKLNDSDKQYGMKVSLVPTNGILSSFEFGPNLSNTTNSSTVNGQQSITVSWNLPVGGIVYDPNDQLSSHEDGQGINPEGVITTRADYTVAESTWKIIVPLPYVNTAINFTANVAGVANLGEESFGMGLFVCNKKPDLDGDGKVNAVDIDSDGDGCSDFVEAKSFKWTSLKDQTIAGDFGVNGLSSLVESDDTRSASLNYTVSKNYLDPENAGCIDDDGDGGASVDDIDDDNDGILDQTECPTEPAVSKFGFVRANPAGTQMHITNKVTGAKLGLITIKAIRNIVVDDLIGNENDNSVSGHWFDLSEANATNRVMEIKFEPVAPYTILDLKVLATEGGNGKWGFHPRSLRVDGGIAGSGVIRAIPQRYYLREKYGVGDTIKPNMKMSTAFTGMLGGDANKVFIQVQYDAAATKEKPLVLKYTWNSLAGGVWNENFGFQLLEMVPMLKPLDCDYDGDGLNDDKDTDSDNDGCSDAQEARHAMPLTADKMHVAGPYGENGFTKYFETNDTPQATYTTTGWLPAPGGTIATQKDYVNENVKTRCLIPFIVPAGPTEFCDPGQVVLNINLNGGIVPASYQWFKDDVLIPSATAASYTATETGDFTCTLTYADGTTVTTDPQDVTENPLPAAPTVTGYTVPVCLGTPIILTSSYATKNQWYYNDNLVAGATSATYNVTASGDYKVEYTDSITGCKSYSITKVVVIGATPEIPKLTIIQPTCLTAAGAITSSGNPGDTYSLDGITYQSSNSFNNKAPGTYTVYVKNSEGCASAAATAVINAQPASPVTPTITAAPGTAICSGGATTLTSSASTGNQWIKDGLPIAGAINATYTAAFPGEYTVQVTNTSGCSTISAATTITVAPSPTASLAQSLELGSTNCGTANPIKLTASTDAVNPTYAWYLNDVLIGGATASTHTAVATGNYTVKITNATGCSTTSAPSSVTTGPSASAGSPASICAGQTFTFVASTSGLTNTTYTWEYRATNAGTWASATAPRNNISYVAAIAGEYRVVVTGTDGSSNAQTINSCPTSLAVNALPTVSIGANPSGALCAGQMTVLTATANHSSPATIATYQWINGTTNISGATIATYTTGIASSYAVLVTDTYGCQATSIATTVAVNPLPATPTSTVTQPSCSVATGTITVADPLGAAYTYSLDGGAYQSSPIFSVLAVGTHTVKAKLAGCEGAALSEVITAPPSALTITGAISGNTTPFNGATENYSIAPVVGAISYVWTLPNGWTGSSNSNSILASTTLSAGNISVKAVNAAGCESAPVLLALTIKPAKPSIDGNATTYCEGAAATSLTAIADAGGIVKWYSTATSTTALAAEPTPSTSTAGLTSYFVSQIVNGVESDRAEIVVTVNAIPAQPATITGAIAVNPNSTEIYSVVTVAGVTRYEWTLPTGWTGISSSNQISAGIGSTAGVISVVAVANGCYSTAKAMLIKMEISDPPSVADIIYCQNATAVSLTATASIGGSLQWYTTATSTPALSGAPTPSSLVVGSTTYYVSQIVNGVESGRAMITVTVNALPASATPVIIQPTCDINTGTIQVTPSGIAGETYNIDGSAYQPINEFTLVSSGTHSIQIKNASGCLSTLTSAIVDAQPTQPAAPTATVSTSCSVVTGTVTVSSSIAGLRFSIDGTNFTNTTGVFTGLAAGNYSLTAKNTSGCTSDATSITVNAQQPTPATPTAIVTLQPTCNVGTGTIYVSSSTVGLTFSIDGSTYTNTSGIFSSLSPGIYNATARNSSGCTSDPTSVVVNAQPAPAISPVITITQLTCSISTGTISITSTGAVGDTYSIDDINYQSSKTFSSLAAGTYTVTVKSAGGCISDAELAILSTQPATPSTPTITSSTASSICAGTAATLTSSAVTGNQWYENGVLIAGATSQTYTTALGGIFTVVTTNSSGCSSIASATYTLTANPIPSAVIAQGAQLAFTNCETTSLTLSATTGATSPTYQWYLGGDIITSATSATYIATTAGSYTVMITGSGCSNTSAATKIATIPAADATGSTSVCQGNGVLLSTSSTGTYQWQVNTGSGWANVAGAGTNATYTALVTGDYQIVIGGTSISCPITVTANPLPTVSVSVVPSATVCAGSTSTLTASASGATPYTYQWLTGGNEIASATSDSYNSPISGDYAVRVTDFNGCQLTTSNTTITVNPPVSSLTVGTITQPTCSTATGTVVLNSLPSGNWTITSSVGTVVNGTGSSYTFTGLPGGITYTFTVTNSLGCTSPASQNVVVDAQPITPTAPASTITQPSCTSSIGIISVTGNAGDSYSIDGINYQSSNIFNVVAGAYSITIKTEYGCVSAASAVTINAQPATPATPTVSVTTQPTCSLPTGTITVSSSTTGLTFSIDGINYTNTTGIFTGVEAGKAYNVTSKNASGCTSTETVVVLNEATPTATTATVTEQPTCSKATGTITISSSTVGLNFSIDGINYTNTSGVFTGLTAGTYTITSKNASGCISVPITLTVNTQPTSPAAPTASATAQPTCTVATGTIAVSSSTTGVSFSINGGAYTNTTGSFEGLVAGNYTITSKNAAGCISAPTFVTINTQPSTPAAPTASATAQPTCSVATGKIKVSSSIIGLTFSIDGISYNNTTGIFDGLAAGTYSVTARNASSCSSTATIVTINSQPLTPDAPTASVSSQPSCLVATGTVTVSSTTTGLSFSIDGMSYTNTSGIFAGLVAGTYNVTAKNAAGCIGDPISVTVNAQPVTPAKPTISNATSTTFCSGGSVILSSNATTGNQWYKDGVIISGAVNQTYTVNTSGVYTVIVNSVLGCSSVASDAITVTVGEIPTATILQSSGMSYTNCSSNGPSITLTASTGASNPIYQWYLDGVIINGANSATYTAITVGNYTVKISNNTGCSTVSAPNKVESTPSLSSAGPATVCVGNSFTFNASAVGFTSPTYLWQVSTDGTTWTNAAGTNNATTYNASDAGKYHVVVTDATHTTTSCPTSLATNTLPTVSIAALPSTSVCSDATATLNATAAATTVGGSIASYQWQMDGVSIKNAVSASYAAKVAGSFTLVITDNNGCQSTSLATAITVNQVPFAPIVSVSEQPTCTYASGTITVSSSTTGLTFSINGVDYYNNSGIFKSVSAGTYSVTARNASGCTSSATIVVVNDQPATPVAPIASVSAQPTCLVLTGTITVSSPVAGLQYSIDGTTYTNVKGIFSGLAPGIYNISAINAAGCTSNETTLIVNGQPAPAVAPIFTITQPNCSSSTGIISVATTGVSSDNYSIDGFNYQSSPIFNTVETGAYNITVKSSGGCVSNAGIGLVNTQPAIPSNPIITSSTTSSVCAGAAVTLTSSAATGNQWYKNGVAIAGATNQTYKTALGGIFTVVTTNANGCSSAASFPYTLTVNPIPTSVIAQGAQLAFTNCETTSLTLSASTDVASPTYQWYIDGGSITSATSSTYSATTAGSYTVVITGSGGCSNTSAATIIKTIPTASVTGSTSVCQGNGVLLSTSSTGTYQWQVNTGTSWTNVASGGISSTYTAVVSGDYKLILNGSSTSCPITVKVNPIPTVSVSIVPSATVCAGSTSTLTASASGATSYTYQWMTSGVAMASEISRIYFAQTGGDYAVRVTDNNGCQFTTSNSTITVNQPVSSLTVGTITQPTCSIATGTVVLNGLPTGNWTITPSVGTAVSGTGTTYTFTGLRAGTAYKFTTTNSLGCTSTASVSVVVDAQPVTPAAPVANITQPDCFNSVATITVIGKSGDVYSINGINYQSSNIFNVVAGTYTLTIRNSLGCVSPATILTVNAVNKNLCDSDGDGVSDAQEALDGTDPNDPCSFKLSSQTLPTSSAWKSADCDGDGLTNQEEKTGIDDPATPADPGGKITDPLNKDTDGDGVSDAQEALDGTNPNDPCSLKVSSQTLPTSAAWKSADCDGDGLTNQEEKTGIDDPATPANPGGKITDPLNKDTDGDGVSDAQEALDGTNPNDPCSFKLSSQTLPTSAAWKSADCDGDGLTNQEEKTGIDDPATPADPGGKITDPLNKDTDGDGVSDAQEALDGTNPNDPCSFKLTSQKLTPTAAWLAADCDGDGVTNGKEIKDGTNPSDPCSLKYLSQTLTPTAAWLAADCDGDGVLNGKEKSDGTDPSDPCSLKVASQTLTPTVEWKVLDCDGDGVPNGREITDGTNPNDPCSLKLQNQTLVPNAAWMKGDCNGDKVPNGEVLIVTKYAAKPELQNDGSMLIKYTVVLRNIKPEAITNITVKDDLSKVFLSPVTFTVTGTTASGLLVKTANYNGKTTIDLVSSSSKLAGYSADSVTISVTISPNGFSGNVDNMADVTGDSKWGPIQRQSIDTVRSGGRVDGSGVFNRLELPSVEIVIPGGFSPNGDGINDRFEIVRPTNTTISLQIFNRWGNAVYINSDYKNDWKGKGTGNFLGQDVPDGTYYYIVNATNKTTNQVRNYVGFITLKR